jgi:lipopolysaccharide transport system ATP-binding protein
MKPAIRVEKLSKQYRLGTRGGAYQTLREALMHSAGRAWSCLRGKKPDGAAARKGAFWALRDVSFEVEPGEVVGIIGRNGAGKSTLLKILSKIVEPTSGRAQVRGRMGSLLEVGTGFHQELTGRENIYLNGSILGMGRRDIDRKFDEIVAFAEIDEFLDTPVKRYSSGMYVRLAFAVAAHLEPEILVVDEVLAVGDVPFQKKCLAKMDNIAHQHRTILFVSHNLPAVSSLCTRAILIDNGEVKRAGTTSEVIAEFRQMMVPKSQPDAQPHVLYERPASERKGPFEIVRLELLDAAGQPKPMVSTWDDVTIRVHYAAQEHVQEGSVVIFLGLMSEAPLLLLSTQPDSTVPMAIRIGKHYVDCHLKQLPLSGGTYLLGAGLAVPNKRYLCKEENLAQFTVFPADVFGSGLRPTAARALLAVPHTWKVS